MKQVYKYPLIPGHTSMMLLPEGFKPVKIDIQDGLPHMWAIVDPAKPMETIHYTMVPTGQTIPEGYNIHLGSFLARDGALVFHVFQQGGDPQ